VVTADSTGQAGRNSNNHQFTAGEHGAYDGQQHAEGAPRGTGGECQTNGNHKYDGRQEVCQTAGVHTDKFSNKDLCTQIQQDDCYLAFAKAKEATDNDQVLQDKIGEFNLEPGAKLRIIPAKSSGASIADGFALIKK